MPVVDAPGMYVCSICGTDVVAVAPSWNVHANEIIALFGFETCAEKSQVHGSPGFADALSGPMSTGQHAGTANESVSVGLHGGLTPGTVAETAML